MLKNLDKLIERGLASLERVDLVVAEALLLLKAANAELEHTRKLRERLQAAVAEPKP